MSYTERKNNCGRANCTGNNMNNGTNNNMNNDIENNEEYYGDYPLDYEYYANNGGFNCNNHRYSHHSEQIFEYNSGNNVDLSNMNVQDSVVAAQLTVDVGSNNGDNCNNHTRSGNSAQVKISFSCNLNYTMTLNEEMNILFKLYRQDSNGMRIELTSIPYTVSYFGELTTGAEITNENISMELKKNETFYTEYFDELKAGGMYTYVMQVNMVYNSLDSASIQSGYISATGQITREYHR